MSKMSPLQVRCLLHFYYSPEPAFSVPTASSTELLLEELGALKVIPDGWKLTELGLAWVESILSTEIPRVAYMDKHNEEIVVTQ